MSGMLLNTLGLLGAFCWLPCAANVVPKSPDSVRLLGTNAIQDYTYQGCYSDSDRYPQLGGNAYESDNLTPEQCLTFCDNTHYAYAGLKDGRYCYCGTVLKGNSTAQDPNVFCNIPCPANCTENCGGANSFSLYHNPNFVAYTNPGPGCSVSLGCYSEAPGVPALDFKLPVEGGPFNMTVANCVQACLQNGYGFAEVEASNACYCGNAIEPSSVISTNPYGCTYRCTGNITEYCGGANYANIYSLAGC
ncbi:WSC domain-containing protein [Xylariaceae sp. FL1651]|nr:WSC domain-containing protein [Xylariaceae sp. FL1651]